VEIDRGRPVATWRDKIRAYHAYMNSPALHKRYNTAAFVLLTITTDDTHRRKLMEATAQVQTAAQRLPGNRSVPSTTIETTDHVFIR
jgi:hypothetical protein